MTKTHDGASGKSFPEASDNLRRPRKRPPDLDPARAADIIGVIGRMAGRVDWAAVVAAVAASTGHTYTRQTLSGHVSISAAYSDRKRGKAPKPARRSRSSSMQAALERIKVVEAQRDAARLEVAALVEANQRYVANAQDFGMSIARLVAPLSRTDRS